MIAEVPTTVLVISWGTEGSIVVVIVDLRRSPPTFSQEQNQAAANGHPAQHFHRKPAQHAEA